MPEPYYRRDLARVHHEGFAFHAADVAPGVLALLAPIRDSGGLVVEFGCGSGLLTRELIAAGHRVIATDASPAMLDLARETAPGAEAYRVVALPDDALPAADAIVGVGHPINYLPSLEAIHAALAAMAGALRPGGLLAFDVCDLTYGEGRADGPGRGWVAKDWALVTEFSRSRPPTGSCARWRSSAATTTGPGDATTSATTTSCSTSPRSRGCCGPTASPPRCATRSATEALPAGLKVVVGRKAS